MSFLVASGRPPQTATCLGCRRCDYGREAVIAAVRRRRLPPAVRRGGCCLDRPPPPLLQLQLCVGKVVVYN